MFQTTTTSVEDTQPIATIPIPQPRRSIHKRKPPAWISSGDYVVESHMANVHTAPEWETKVQYMMDFVSQGILSNNDVKHTMLNILS